MCMFDFLIEFTIFILFGIISIAIKNPIISIIILLFIFRNLSRSPLDKVISKKKIGNFQLNKYQLDNLKENNKSVKNALVKWKLISRDEKLLTLIRTQSIVEIIGEVTILRQYKKVPFMQKVDIFVRNGLIHPKESKFMLSFAQDRNNIVHKGRIYQKDKFIKKSIDQYLKLINGIVLRIERSNPN